MAADNNDFTHEFQIYSTDLNAGTIGTGKFLLFDDNINALLIENINNIKIGGGEEGQVLVTDGQGNLIWATSSGGGGVAVNADWNSSSGASRILNKPDLTAYLPKSGGTLTGKLNAAQGPGTTGGYSFGGTEGGNDTGMFSNADGVLDFYSNAVKIVTVTTDGLTSTQAITLPSNPTSNLQAATKQYVDSAVSALNNFSGNYNDLTNKPTVATGAYIGTTQVAFNRTSGNLTLTGVSIDGNAATVSNGVYTNGSYSNPAWITSLAYSKLTGAPSLASVATSGSYSDLTNKPALATVATSGSYSDLTNRPNIFSGSYTDLTNKPTLFDGAYLSLTGRPNLAAVATSGSYEDLTNKPSIPTNVSDLTNDSGYITLSQVPVATYISSGNSAPGSAVVANNTNVSINFSDGGSGKFVFNANGQLQLALGGDIVDSAGNSLLGGGSGVSLPADAQGFLANDGTGTLSWASAPARLVSPNGDFEVTLDNTGAVVLSSYGVVKNPDHVNMVSDGWVQMQWVDTNTLENADPNATSGPTNWIYVDGNGIHVETNINMNIGDSIQRYDWLFDNYGKLQMPSGGDIVDSSGNSVLGGSGGTTYDQSLNTTDNVTFNNVKVSGNVTSLTTLDLVVGTGIHTGTVNNLDNGGTNIHIPLAFNSDIGNQVKVGDRVSAGWGMYVTTVTNIATGSGPMGAEWIFTVADNIGLGFSAGSQVTFGTATKTWTFDPDGTLTLPNGLASNGTKPSPVLENFTLVDWTGSVGASGNDFAVIGSAHPVTGSGFNVVVKGGNGTGNVGIGGDVNITSGTGYDGADNGNVFINSGSATWSFDYNGNLTLPAGGDIKDINGTSVLGGGGVSLPANAPGYLTNDGNGNLAWAAGDGTFSGDYNDLINKPTIPTNVSDLNNDSGFITSADLPGVPTNVSELNNDAGYITNSVNGSKTRTEFANITTGTAVVWTGSYTYTTSAKLTLQVECNEAQGPGGWDVQVCEAILATRGGEPVMTVYGVTHTSVNPLVTFTVQKNQATGLIEVLGTLTATAVGTAFLRIHSVEMTTRD